jgi:Na+/phosphate symporter
MKFIFMRILKNIGLALIAKPMVFFGLRLISKSTTNLVDDKIIDVVENAYDGDMVKLELSLKSALGEIQKELKKT